MKSCKVFQPDLVYVFSHKKLKQYQKKQGMGKTTWGKYVNGQVVNVVSPVVAHVGKHNFSVTPDWCKAIKKK